VYSQPQFFEGQITFFGGREGRTAAYVTMHVYRKMVAIKIVFASFFVGGGQRTKLWGSPYDTLSIDLQMTISTAFRICIGLKGTVSR